MTRLSYLLKRLARLDRSEQVQPRTLEFDLIELERREITKAIETCPEAPATRLEML